MDKRAEEIISSYEKAQSDDILKQFNSLKPKPFSGLISLATLTVCMLLLHSYTELVIFEGEYYWFIMAFIFVTGAIESESRKINKRIDLLAKLVHAKKTNQENTE